MTRDQAIRIFVVLTFVIAALIVCINVSEADTRLYVPNPVFHGYDKATGLPLSGGLLYSYQANSSATKELYTDRTGGTAHANPVVLNSAGAKIIYGSGTYKLILKDRNNVTQWTMDYVMFPETTDFAITLLDDGTAADARATLGLGSSATKDVGITAWDIVQLDSSAKLPAVDGSNLTGLTDTDAFPPGHIWGLKLANQSTDPDHNITVAAGNCRSVANGVSSSTDMTLASTLTKYIDVAWTEGDGGGYAGASAWAASTWYYCYLIANVTTVDLVISDQSDDPSDELTGGLADYDYWRRVGCIRTDADKDIIAFAQYGDDFLLDTPEIDIHETLIADTTDTFTLSYVPSGLDLLEVIANVVVSCTPGDYHSPYLYIAPPGRPGIVPTQTGPYNPPPTGSGGYTLGVTSGKGGLGSRLIIRVTASTQISTGYDSSQNYYGQLDWWTVGWIDRRGRD